MPCDADCRASGRGCGGVWGVACPGSGSGAWRPAIIECSGFRRSEETCGPNRRDAYATPALPLVVREGMPRPIWEAMAAYGEVSRACVCCFARHDPHLADCLRC